MHTVKKLAPLLLVLAIHVQAQVVAPNFLNNDYNMYKGAYLTIDTTLGDRGFHERFFAKFDDVKNDKYENRVLYANKERGGGSWWRFSSKDSLAGRTFKVEDITGYIFTLRDTVTTQQIYFVYNYATAEQFPFISSKIFYDNNYLRSKIERTVDDMTGEVKLETPKYAPMALIKSITKTSVSYYLSLSTIGYTPVVDGTGITILFSDGTKLTKSSKINVDVKGSTYAYNAFIALTSADVLLLSTKKIKKFRLYIFDREIDAQYGGEFAGYVSCIKGMK